MEPTLENGKLQSKVVSWGWLETGRADSHGIFPWHRMRTEVYPDGDGQPRQDFQARLENTQAQMENGPGSGAWRLRCQVAGYRDCDFSRSCCGPIGIPWHLA